MCLLLLFTQPSWISVDFDNWRDWEHEEDEGKEEYDRYVDVSISGNLVMQSSIQVNVFGYFAVLFHNVHIILKVVFKMYFLCIPCFGHILDDQRNGPG